MSKYLGAMKLAGATKHRVKPDPSLVLYRDRPQAPLNGVGRLPAAMTINGITEYPTARYTAGGGLVTVASWEPWGYGEAAAQVVVGTAPTPDWGSPCVGPFDSSVLFNGSDYYQPTTTIVSSNHDRVIQLFFRTPTNTGTLVICGTGRGGGLASGWNFYTASGNLRFAINDGAVNVVLGPVAMTAMCWHYVEVYYDHGGNMRMFVNGTDVTGAQSVSTLGNVANTSPIALGANEDGSLPYTTGHISYLAYYQRVGWLDTDNQTAVAELNASRVWGWRPQQARGTAVPTVRTRASNAYLDKSHYDGTRRLYLVGNNIPRAVERVDKNGRTLKGYLPEVQITNIARRSEEIDDAVAWTPVRASVTNTSTTGLPNGITSLNDVLHEDATAAATHYHYQTTVIAVGIRYCISCFCKQINRTWLALNPRSGGGLSSAFFDVANVAVGTIEASLVGATSGIIPFGNGWCRCWLSWISDSANPGLAVFIATGDLARVFNGLNQDSLYLWGVQIEEGVDYPTSYTPTAAAAVIREEDTLRYRGDDGNLGGVGSNRRGQINLKMLCEDYDATLAKRLVTLSDGGAAADQLYLRTAASDVLNAQSAATGGGAGSWVGTTDVIDGAVHDVQLPYKTDNLGPGRVDGAAEGAADTDCGMPDDIDRIGIGCDESGTMQPGTVLADVELFPREER